MPRKKKSDDVVEVKKTNSKKTKKETPKEINLQFVLMDDNNVNDTNIKDDNKEVSNEEETKFLEIKKKPSLKSRTWTQYTSERINRTYFVPVLGLAYRFYPHLYFCEDKVKLETFINGKKTVYEEGSISDKRSDFDFLSVIVKWRTDYLKDSMHFTAKQVEEWLNFEDDIIALHNIIRVMYNDRKIKDLIQMVKTSTETVHSYLNKHNAFEFLSVDGYTCVEDISRLYIKFDIEFKFKELDKSYTKTISVILE